MYTGDLETNTFIFESAIGDVVSIEGGEWDWGSYYNYTHGVDAIKFAELVAGADIKDLRAEFPGLIDDYFDRYEGEDSE